MSANERFKKGDETTKKLKKLLEEKKIVFEEIGREHTIKNKEISKKLSFDSSTTSCFIRFQPDLLIYRNDPCLIEVKTGKTISKEAYHHYLKLETIGLNILLFFFTSDSWYYAKPSEIEFYSWPSKNGFMYHSLVDLNIPVQGHWIYPRRMNQADLEKYKKFFGGSGVCFANIDIKKLKKFK